MDSNFSLLKHKSEFQSLIKTKEPLNFTSDQERDFQNGIMDAKDLNSKIYKYEESMKKFKCQKKHLSAE